MASDWWFLALLGSGASAVGSALGTAASGVGSALGGAASALGHAAGSAAGAIGTGATSALNALGVGSGAGPGGAAAPAATTTAAPAVAGDLGASGTAAPATASSVSTANLPPAAGGQTLSSNVAQAQPPPSMASQDPASGLISRLSPGSGNAYSTASLPATAGTTYPPMASAAGQYPTLSEITNVPELGQYSAGAAQQPTPTTFALSPAQGGVTPGGGGFLSSLAPYGQQIGRGFLQRYGITDPSASWGDIAHQGVGSMLAGSPYFGQAGEGWGTTLGGAVRQRLLSQLFPESGGRSPQDIQQTVAMLMNRQNPVYARNLPLYGNLPGYG